MSEFLMPADGPNTDVSAVPLDKIDMSQQHIWTTNSHWPYFARLREHAPVHFCTESQFGPFWSVSTYKDIFFVDTHHNLFSSVGGITLANQSEGFELPMFIAMDPPKHDAQRKAVQPIVGATMLDALQPIIRERIAGILDDLPRNETFDWVDRVSIELTTQMLATLFDFPFEDRRKLTRWSDVATGRGNRAIVESEEQWRGELLECADYFSRLWAERIKAPPKQDLISLMAHDPATRDMPKMEFLGNLILLIVGGNDTTRNSLTGGVIAFNETPAEFAKLRADRALVDEAASEIIRWQTPLAHMRRTARTDVELNGQNIRAGDKVVMWYVSGNRDETAIEHADAFRIDRPRVRQHLSFGYGIHRCVGMRLAEMQLRTTWEEILKRFERIEVMGPPGRIASSFVHGYSSLPVRVT